MDDEEKNGMGSLPVVSILRGPSKPLTDGVEPILIHRIIEHTVRTLKNNKNNEKTDAIHSINLAGFTAESIALIDHTAGKNINYIELNDSANKLARAILNHIKKPGRKVKPNSDGDFVIATFLNPSEAQIITLLAVWKTGAAYLPMGHAFPVNRVQHILNETEPVLIIADFIDEQKFENRNSVTYGELKASSSKLQNSDVPEEETLTKDVPDENKIAVIFYTSGSTGTPKGVRVFHKSILNLLRWQGKTFPYQPFEKVCAFITTYTFGDSMFEIWFPLCFGRSVLILSREDCKNTEKLIDLLEQYKIYRISLVVSMLSAFLVYLDVAGSSSHSTKTFTNRLPDLLLWTSTSENLCKSVAEKFFSILNPKTHTLFNLFGVTEVLNVSYWIVEPDQLEKLEKVPIGKNQAIDNCCIYLLNSDLKPVKINEVGEICASGIHVTPGYVKQREAERFIDNPFAVDPNHGRLYRTGDYGKMMKDETDDQFVLYFEGRTDSQIKIRGHRVNLSEVESAVASIPEIEKCAVLAFRAGEVDQALLAYVTLKPPKTTTEKDIGKRLRNLLTYYMIPRVIVIDRMPYLSNEKIDRQLLLKRYESEFCPKTDLSAIDYAGVPTTLKEKAKALFETVAVTLGPNLIGRIDSSANFFSLGGNSLNSVHVVAKLRDLGYVIGVDKFISAKNLLEVASTMVKSSTETGIAEVTRIPEDKYKIEMISEKHKKDAYDIISSSFQNKGDLESWLNRKVPRENYFELMDFFWPTIIRQNLSFAVRGPDGKVKSVCLNFDANDEPDLPFRKGSVLATIFDFLGSHELPAKKKHSIPEERGKVLHAAMAGVQLGTPAKDSVEIFMLISFEVLKLAKERGFVGVFCTNTSPLTQQIALDVHHYQMLEEVQANEWKDSKGNKPFQKAPEDLKIHICYKPVN